MNESLHTSAGATGILAALEKNRKAAREEPRLHTTASEEKSILLL